MKLDLNAAWDQAVRLIAFNREVVLVLAGVFFFLPQVLFLLLVPIPDLAAAAPAGESSPAMVAAINGFIAEYWWAILLLTLVQTLGGIAVMAVVGDPARPTVSDAMRRGGTYLLSSIAAQLLISFALTLVFFAAIFAGAVTGSRALVVTLSLFVLPLILWLGTRLSLSGASIAIERIGNPVTALRRSWRLTDGSGFRLTAFYILLFAAFFVISQVLGLVVTLVTALLGAELAKVLDALFGGLIYAALMVVAYAVLASVHRQLAREQRVSVPGTPAGDP
ncbi:hypothetical protein [Qipengyuania sediminis]|uniref:hypothetical protein n=1 Tax=Qipengyuania sediminis TaxID=1532023 RepID=UPI001059D16A|nr:hypothetical protein [Qipengyuania sediminis]